MSEPRVFYPPKLPLAFPRTEWYDTEWWKQDTKWHRMAWAAQTASWLWLNTLLFNERDGEVAPWQFKLAVFDRVNQM